MGEPFAFDVQVVHTQHPADRPKLFGNFVAKFPLLYDEFGDFLDGFQHLGETQRVEIGRRNMLFHHETQRIGQRGQFRHTFQYLNDQSICTVFVISAPVENIQILHCKLDAMVKFQFGVVYHSV